MRIHILGICGTFMAGIAVLAKQAGHVVFGSDVNVYPPMSDQLEKEGIRLFNGYYKENITEDIDCVIVGNVIKRGNEAMEYVMEKNIPYISGPEWLHKNILHDRHVIAISGTHGKTTTTSIVLWLLKAAGFDPGFLVGGIPQNFGISAYIGKQPFFVIEADEYDSAFFDKRSKFLHYRPKTLVLNNLEFDHADIFADLAAIQLQFHYLVRTVPQNGRLIVNGLDNNLAAVLTKGCWSEVEYFAHTQSEWQSELINQDGSVFSVYYKGKCYGTVNWSLLGTHNVQNALAALAAVNHLGISIEKSIKALAEFKNVKRRLEKIGEINGVTIYDDFAHHPTAIATTLQGLRAKVGRARIIAVLEFGSYTMKTGVHKHAIKEALSLADEVFCKETALDWDLKGILKTFPQPTTLCPDVSQLINALIPKLQPKDHVIIMSNTGFDALHKKLIAQLSSEVVS